MDARPPDPVVAPPEGVVVPPGAPVVTVGLGQRVTVLSDLCLAAAPTPASLASSRDVADLLDRWPGAGIVVVAGNFFAAFEGTAEERAGNLEEALAGHPELARAIGRFTERADRRFLVVPGWRDRELAGSPEVARALVARGAELAPAVILRLVTGAGERDVLVQAATPVRGTSSGPSEPHGGPRPWLAGWDHLEDPWGAAPFVTSRILYRRLGPLFVGLALLPIVVAVLLRLPVVFRASSRLFNAPGPRHALLHAYTAPWTHRAVFTLGVIGLVLAASLLVLALASRAAWRALGGEGLPRPWPWRGPRLDPAAGQDRLVPSSGLELDGSTVLDAARAAVGRGLAGLVAGGGLRPELTHLDPGFYASPGGSGETVREHPGRAGLPPAFLAHRQVSWLELETGADLHVRLLTASQPLPGSARLERLSIRDRIPTGHTALSGLHPQMVASWPRGSAWPPSGDAAARRVVVRRVRRLAGAAILLTGLASLLEAVTPPLRSRLVLVEQFLPLGVSQAAGALVALTGIALMMLARGVWRGQRRSWAVAVGLLGATVVLHLLRGADLAAAAIAGLVLGFLVHQHEKFGAASDGGSVATALGTLGAGVAASVGTAVAAVELSGRFRHRPLPSGPIVAGAVAERLVGVQSIALPDSLNDFLAPSMLAIGIALAVVALYLLTRPVVDRRLSAGHALAARRAAESRARDIVRRHGVGTLDYFALRDDKQWFFHRDSLVAYGVYGGICLVSPDPIGPRSEREMVWSAFRRYADRHGWALAVMAAGEDWLAHYRDSGMRHVYIGDEAVVDVQSFSLAGGKMKGLRQAVARIDRYGYRARVLDPASASPDEVAALVDLMGRKRRGDDERGFSMMLGRIFDPRDSGLLLTVVDGPDGQPAAMCQFVPSPAIGGYSLDLMRRDPGAHPNGLIDFALCSTIEHLRRHGSRGLSLNFSAMRSILDGEKGDGVTQRVERWALRRMSGFLQIETLWRFNAKYEPSWLPRYIAFDSPEHFVPVAVQILRAESLTDIPVVGRLLGQSPARRAATGIVVPASQPVQAGRPPAPAPRTGSLRDDPAPLEEAAGQ